MKEHGQHPYRVSRLTDHLPNLSFRHNLIDVEVKEDSYLRDINQAAVRLGGVHALTGLADDAPTPLLRQTCIDVLCAYLRLPYTAEADLPAGDTEARHAYLALREVRHTVIRLIRDRSWPDPKEEPLSWQGHDLDFTGAVFDGGDFSGAVFSGGARVSFRDAVFTGGTVDFSGVEFADATVDFTAEFSDGRVDFSDALFSDGTVTFGDSLFSEGRVDFRSARFCGGTVDFRGAMVTGSRVDFESAVFSDGRVDLRGAAFSDGAEVSFRGAAFSDGMVDFRSARFGSASVDFSRGHGVAPVGLVPADGLLPQGLIVPQSWLPPTL